MNLITTKTVGAGMDIFMLNTVPVMNSIQVFGAEAEGAILQEHTS